ncbi:hypothetical protein H2248_002197 [Termitomyces sp. 'cryptogamus']|nr:hypothetical protein H2248_002197 [Termitomyces sp. 'cryptogamus']
MGFSRDPHEPEAAAADFVGNLKQIHATLLLQESHWIPFFTTSDRRDHTMQQVMELTPKSWKLLCQRGTIIGNQSPCLLDCWPCLAIWIAVEATPGPSANPVASSEDMTPEKSMELDYVNEPYTPTNASPETTDPVIPGPSDTPV